MGGSEVPEQVAESTIIQNIIQKQKEKTRFQVTAFDILFNPLR
jgi:hypothetical protein